MVPEAQMFPLVLLNPFYTRNVLVIFYYQCSCHEDRFWIDIRVLVSQRGAGSLQDHDVTDQSRIRFRLAGGANCQVATAIVVAVVLLVDTSGRHSDVVRTMLDI